MLSTKLGTSFQAIFVPGLADDAELWKSYGSRMATRIRKNAVLHLYIAEHREAKGMTQERLGGLLGVGKNTVSRWEIDQKRLNPIKIANIAHALGLEPEELWRPPTKRPSIDAMLKNASDELAQSVADLARSLTRRAS